MVNHHFAPLFGIKCLVLFFEASWSRKSKKMLLVAEVMDFLTNFLGHMNDVMDNWVVVSNICYFHPYLGKWSNLTNIFQMGFFPHFFHDFCRGRSAGQSLAITSPKSSQLAPQKWCLDDYFPFEMVPFQGTCWIFWGLIVHAPVTITTWRTNCLIQVSGEP